MIADLDESIRELMIRELPIKNGEVEISFDQPKREWSARLSKPTLNFFLYDLRENPVLRSHQWQTALTQQPGGDLAARQKRTPYRVDCYYMITSWAAEAEDEHRLLTRALMALFRFPILPEDVLAGILKKQPYELKTTLASHEQLSNPSDLWSALDNELKPSIPFVVTLALDPWTEVFGPVVHTLRLRTRQASKTVRDQLSSLEGALSSEMNFIGGTIWRKVRGGEPAAGVEIAVKGTGYFTQTDEHGAFRLGGLPAGDYRLVAWVGEGKPVERAVTIPARNNEDYDVVIP